MENEAIIAERICHMDLGSLCRQTYQCNGKTAYVSQKNNIPALINLSIPSFKCSSKTICVHTPKKDHPVFMHLHGRQ
jgi:hypothetical protein